MRRQTVAARLFLATSSCALGTAALASETISYSYDALGRLVATTSSGGVNNGLATGIAYDPAGNRQSYTVSGAGAGGGAPLVLDGSFEDPPQSAGGYTYNPVVTGVTFNAGAGVTANGSAWGFPDAPSGNQVGFLQANGSIVMSVSGLTAGSSYTIRFWMAPRPSTGPTPVTVSVGGTSLGRFTPVSAGYVTTVAFTAAGTTASLTFSTSATTDVSTAIDAVTVAEVSTPVVADNSFESPAQGGGYAYNPTVPGATFANASGIAGNGSAWGFAAAPDGNQVAFLQGTGAISLSVTGLTAGQSYAVRFRIAQRPGYAANPVAVSFAGTALGSFTPGSSAFALITTTSFTATGSTGTLVFATSTSGGDYDSGIDAVSVVPGP